MASPSKFAMDAISACESKRCGAVMLLLTPPILVEAMGAPEARLVQLEADKEDASSKPGVESRDSLLECSTMFYKVVE